MADGGIDGGLDPEKEEGIYSLSLYIHISYCHPFVFAITHPYFNYLNNGSQMAEYSIDAQSVLLGQVYMRAHISLHLFWLEMNSNGRKVNFFSLILNFIYLMLFTLACNDWDFKKKKPGSPFDAKFVK